MPSLDTLNALCNEQGDEIKALERDAIRRQRDHRMVVDARDAELLAVRNQVQELQAHIARSSAAHEKQLDTMTGNRDMFKQLADEQARIADQHARQRDEAMSQRDEARANAEDKQQVINVVRSQRDEAREAVARLGDMLARAQTERDAARQLLETSKAQVITEAEKVEVLTKACADALKQVADLRIALDDHGRPTTSLEGRVARLEAINRAREASRAAFRAGCR
ncbi:coiled-coil domain-containing protein [Variovorax paradoxus]|uniref:hypothetical protein n=1 Tax=Variovorax paradoxus TaxID=34073 RepID=UPI0029C82195|nr:hypothetical protein [Variovorax paradoxus]WPH18250.1 hypothetical protein RZE78_14530 [Variovorax paradoxus]